jgi:hypothetical protein
VFLSFDTRSLVNNGRFYKVLFAYHQGQDCMGLNLILSLVSLSSHNSGLLIDYLHTYIRLQGQISISHLPNPTQTQNQNPKVHIQMKSPPTPVPPPRILVLLRVH